MKKLVDGIIMDMTAEEIAASMPSIYDLIKAKQSLVSEWRDREEQGTVSYMGFTWQADKVSRERLAATLGAYPGSLPVGFYWTSVDNIDVSVDRTALAGLLEAMVVKGFAIHQRQRQMKQEIAALTDPQAVEAYVIGW